MKEIDHPYDSNMYEGQPYITYTAFTEERLLEAIYSAAKNADLIVWRRRPHESSVTNSWRARVAIVKNEKM